MLKEKLLIWKHYFIFKELYFLRALSSCRPLTTNLNVQLLNQKHNWLIQDNKILI